MRDETDFQLVNLLQINPRISWSKAGEILRMSLTTVANRWNHLVEGGLAWVCIYSNPECRFAAVVEVDCRTEFLPSATKQMCVYPLTMSVDETTGRCDILLIITALGMAILITLIIDWTGGIDGVYGTRSSLTINVIVGAEPWQANILTQRQANQALP